MQVNKPAAIGPTLVEALPAKIASAKTRADITDEHLTGFIRATGYPADLEITDEVRAVVKHNLVYTSPGIGKKAWRYLVEHGYSTRGLRKVKDNKAQPRRK